MAEYHTIRLHGPWQADFFSSASGESATAQPDGSGSTAAAQQRQRIKLPLVEQAWVESGFTGSIELNRHFNWPHEDVQAVFLHVDSDVLWSVWVNDQPVVLIDSPDKTCLIDCLKSQNQLRLRAEVVAGVQPTIREVSLKIP